MLKLFQKKKNMSREISETINPAKKIKFGKMGFNIVTYLTREKRKHQQHSKLTQSIGALF